MIDLRKEFRYRAGFCAAVAAMLEGLKNQNYREDFTVDMGGWGCVRHVRHREKPLCVGCAATCALQEYFDVDFNADNISNVAFRAAAVNAYVDDVDGFEEAINTLRVASAKKLGHFCSLTRAENKFVCDKFENLPYLTTKHWEERLPAYESTLYEIMVAWDTEFSLIYPNQ